MQALYTKPQDIFKIFKAGDDTNDYFDKLVKSLLDPITKDHSVLDEIYVEGLDASQVFGQTKMVLDGVGHKLLSEDLVELRDKYGVETNEDREEDEEVEDEEDEDEDEQNEVELEGQDEDQNDVEDEDQSEVEDEDDQYEDAEEDQSEVDVEDEQNELGEDEDGVTEGNNDSHGSADEDDSDDAKTLVEEEESGPKKDGFGLNDGFFDLDEFNKQVLALEDEDAEQDDDEEIDYFGDLADDDDEEEMAYYDDMFDKPGSKKTKKESQDKEDLEDEDLNEDEYDNAVGSAMTDLFDDNLLEEEEEVSDELKPKEALSSFEKQQREIQAEIAKLEAELVADKKWTMKGEVKAKDRPEDSLLDDPETAMLEFDRTSKPVPIITDEVTETLEDLIRRRIRNEEFDDLPKRLITDVAHFHNKQKFELSEQKSAKSLAELYEDDYNKVDADKEVNEAVQAQHDEITELFQKVNHKLDSLCSAHYIPKPHQYKTIEIKVTDNAAAAISMEDAQPLHIDSGASLAPQEVYKIGNDKVAADGAKGRSQVLLKSGLSYSKDELSTEDKQRLRRANKRKKTKAYNEKRDILELKDKQNGEKNPNKRQKVGEVVDTLAKAKNVTVIGKKGELTDVKGNAKKNTGPQTSNSLKL